MNAPPRQSSNLRDSTDRVPRVRLDQCLDYEQPDKYIVSGKDVLEDKDGIVGVPVLTPGHAFRLGLARSDATAFPASRDRPVILFDDFTTAFRLVDFPFLVKSSAVKILTPLPGVNLRYVFHAMRGIDHKSPYHSRHWISRYSKFTIPYPSKDEQNRIVAALDDMDDLVDILEREIELRKAQLRFLRSRLIR